MNETAFLQQLQQANSEEERTWLVTEMLLDAYPPDVKEAAIAAAVPHYFNAAILAALLRIEPADAERRYQAMQAISFAEKFGDAAHALHDLTRAAILDHLRKAQPDLFAAYQQRAFDYFQSKDEPQQAIEAIYHRFAVDATKAMPEFRKQMRTFRRAGNFSATDTLLRYARESFRLGILTDADAVEIERQEFYTAQEFAERGKQEAAPDKAREMLMQALLRFDPTEDVSRYQDAEPAQLRDEIKRKERQFLTQRLDAARLAGDPLRQKLWLNESGWSSAKNADYETALHEFNKTLALEPENSELLVKRSVAYRLLGKYTEALADCDRAIELNPKSAWALAHRGAAYRMLGKYTEALADYEHAIELEPKFAFALAQRGEAYRMLGKYAEAMADLDRALELEPKSAFALASRGAAYRLLDRYAEAIADLDRALELDPKYAWALAHRGAAYRMLGKYAEAIADLDRTIELDPKDALAIGFRGEVLLQTGKYQDALVDFHRAIELKSDGDWWFYERGLTYLMTQQPELAQQDFAEAIRLAQAKYQEQPENWQNAFNLAIYHLAAGHEREAEQLYQSGAAANLPEHRLRAAINDLRDFLRLFPNHAQAQQELKMLQDKFDALSPTQG